jgi:hypothetical protein
MESLEIKVIATNHILTILPLLKELNTYTDATILKNRVILMAQQQNYTCIGVYHNQLLIGVAGLWFLTRHYCGKTIEPDHVIITSEYRNKGIGKILFDWIYNYASEKGYETIELNTYIANVKSHKFYENEGFKKLGYHYLKKL